MRIVATLASLACIGLILWDAFESVVLPRRVTHPFRLARYYYRLTWQLWRSLACRMPAGSRREALLSVFGPLSLLSLFVVWMIGLTLGFALLHWSIGTTLNGVSGEPGYLTYVYLSGTTLFTLGYGDVTPTSMPGRLLAVVESGLGLGFLALVIGYLPTLYQATSRREVGISLLDARAGSPPSAAQLLLRLARSGKVADVNPFLAEWERWSAEVLESHLSYPVLGYYRSQHDNQSWVAALTAVLDSCALLIAGVEGNDPYQAQLTFAMARHAAVDLALVFAVRPRFPDLDRLPADRLAQLRERLREAGLELRQGSEAEKRLSELRSAYEPFVNGLAERLLFALPPVVPDEDLADNWRRAPRVVPRPPGIGDLAPTARDHFG